MRNNILNLTYYDGQDYYSDGSIEDELLEIVKETHDFESVLKKDNRWPVLYHLSKRRKNIIEWFPFESNSNILEIGSGCGAITDIFCKNAKRVTCIELSKKRSLINAYRNKSFDNLEIFVGNFNDIKLEHRYDYITLIGVFEYTKSFVKNKRNPYDLFLEKILNYLKEDGKLIIAIENKFGLKYWSGYTEDHTGNLFESIEGYFGNENVETFSKLEITDILEKSGFNKIDFYYPFPDYKMPEYIFTDSRLPRDSEIKNITHNYDREKYNLFDEEKAYINIINSNAFPFFSNSFLIICSK